MAVQQPLDGEPIASSRGSMRALSPMSSKTVSGEAVTSGPRPASQPSHKVGSLPGTKKGNAHSKEQSPSLGRLVPPPSRLGTGRTARPLAIWAQAAQAARARSSLSGAARALHLCAGAKRPAAALDLEAQRHLAAVRTR